MSSKCCGSYCSVGPELQGAPLARGLLRVQLVRRRAREQAVLVGRAGEGRQRARLLSRLLRLRLLLQMRRLRQALQRRCALSLSLNLMHLHKSTQYTRTVLTSLLVSTQTQQENFTLREVNVSPLPIEPLPRISLCIRFVSIT